MISLVESIFSVPFEEMDGSPIETVSSTVSNVAATRIIRCPWGDRMQMAKEFVGWVEVMGANATQHLPHQYVALSGTVFAKDVKMKPVSRIMSSPEDNQIAAYDTAELTIEYKIQDIGAPGFAFTQDQLDIYGSSVIITESITVAMEFLTLPVEGLYWGFGEDKVALANMSAPAKINTVLEWQYNITGAIYVPNARIFPGKINADVVRSNSLDFTFPIGTLLCGVPIIRKVIKFDSTEYELGLRYYYKNNGVDKYGSICGWNHFPNVNVATSSISWERITDGVDTNRKMYEYATLGGVIV